MFVNCSNLYEISNPHLWNFGWYLPTEWYGKHAGDARSLPLDLNTDTARLRCRSGPLIRSRIDQTHVGRATTSCGGDGSLSRGRRWGVFSWRALSFM